MPDKGWENEDMFVPPGYHINAAVEGEESSPKEEGQVPYVFPSGIGSVLMNGCWGTGYQPNDPCYNSKSTSTICSVSNDLAAEYCLRRVISFFLGKTGKCVTKPWILSLCDDKQR